MHRKDQGKLGESLVISQCLEQGVEVFTDFGDNSKIDLILNTSSRGLVRVQVKCPGREKTSPSSAKLYLTKSGSGYKFKYTQDHVDFFAVVDLATKRIAWIEATKEVVSRQSILLRIDPLEHSKTNSLVSWFNEYEVFPFL